MSGGCDHCFTPLNGAGRRTATRVLCDDCYTQFIGLAARFMAAGTVEEAITTAHWYDRGRTSTEEGRRER